MKLVLLERVEKLGVMGEVVSVRPGFARNFLLPQGKALRANEGNMARFEAEKDALIARNAERAAEAATAGEVIDGETFVMVRSAGESGQLYGSVSSRDIAEIVSESGTSVGRSQIDLHAPIKKLGLHEIRIRLHADVAVTVTINVARSLDEAERQASGEDVIAAQADEDRAIAEAQAADLFEASEEGEEEAERRADGADDSEAPEDDED
ncbi:MAG: large subunit ribosomal protein L9 [Maricaulis sp.]|jgi:large subunit ribosomal protein L9